MKQNRLLAFDITFVVTILLLVLASAFSYRYISNLNKSSELVNHTNLIKLELEQVMSNVKDAESSQRGFLLSGDSVFLPLVANAMSKARQSMDNIKQLTNDNAVQQKSIDQLALLVNKRFARLNYILAIAEKKRPGSAPELIEGKIIMDELRRSIDKMMGVEESLLVEREKEKDKFVQLTPLFSLLFSIVAILIVAFVYSRLRKENKLRTKAESAEATIHNFFQQVPAMLAILKGKEHRFVFANQPYIELIGKRDIVGKPMSEALPEVLSQEFVGRLNKVYETGESYIGKEVAVSLNRNGRLEDVYVNFIYQPYLNGSGTIEGIMVFCYDVSEMISNRKKLEVLEQRSRLAIEASSMGVFDWDLQNQHFIISPRLREIFGFKDKPEATHTDLISRFHPDDRRVRDKAVVNSYEQGSLVYEARVIWEDKSIHWINVFGKVIYDENKEALRMYGTVIDITDRKIVMEVLKESESKFRLLANSLTQHVWTTDAKGNLNYFNQTVYDYSAATENDKDKVGWMNTIHPDEKHDNLKKWSSAVVNGQEFISEHRLRNSQGEYRWHISRAVPQADEHGQIQMWVGTSTDVQEQKNFAEELEKKVTERTEKLFEKNMQLRQSEDRYYTMVNEVQDYAIILLDSAGNIQNWNKGAEKIKGYKAEEIVGNSFKLFYTPGDRAAGLPDQLLSHAVENGKSENAGWRVRKDGSRFWASVVITALHNDKKEVIGFSKVTRDLTEMKNAEEKQEEYLHSIEQKNTELMQTNAELESFNYIASHDLQEPLRKIQAFSQLIMEKEKEKLSEPATDYFNRINNAALRMQNLIEALISYSQTNSSGIQIGQVDLHQLITDIKNDLSNVIEDKQVQVETNHLPVVEGDAIQLQQLFTNLVSNAIKYSKPAVATVIKIHAGIVKGNETGQAEAIAAQEYWKISVEDNGIGFEQKYAEKIFELFQRLHGKLEYQGTGIGLAICKKIMRNHDGFIAAKGKLGVGSIFEIFLPLRK